MIETTEEEKFWSQFEPELALSQQRFEDKYPRKRHERHPKLDALEYYGGGKLACVRCGFSDIRALTLDHINGDGKYERRPRLRSGRSTYMHLRRIGYPEGYQTLCMNCQFIKAHENKEYRGFQNK